MSMNAQLNIRNNAQDMRSYIQDLYEWEDQINTKKKSKKQSNQSVPIRGNVEQQERQEREEKRKQQEQEIFEFKEENSKPDESNKKFKRDINTVESYYKAWDKFDVDKEIEKLEEEKPQQKTLKNPMTEKKEVPKPFQKVQIKGGKGNNLVDVNSIKEKANIFFQSTNYQQAIDLYTEGIKILDKYDQQNIEFKMRAILFSNRAQCQLNLNNYSDCIRDCQQSILSNDKHVKSFVRMGLAQRKMNQIKVALNSFNRAKDLDANDASIKKELEITLKILEKKRNDFKQKMIKKDRTTVYESQIIMVKDLQQNKSIQDLNSKQDTNEVKKLQPQVQKLTQNSQQQPENKNQQENEKNEQQQVYSKPTEDLSYEKKPQSVPLKIQNTQDNSQMNKTPEEVNSEEIKKNELSTTQQLSFDNLINKIDQDRAQVPEEEKKKKKNKNKNKNKNKKKQRKDSTNSNRKESTSSTENSSKRVQFSSSLIAGPYLHKEGQTLNLKSCFKKKHNSQEEDYKKQELSQAQKSNNQEIDQNYLLDEEIKNEQTEKKEENNAKQPVKKVVNVIDSSMIEKIQQQQKSQIKQLVIHNSSDFKKNFNLFKNDPEAQMTFLENFNPQNLKKIFQQDLDPELFVQIIRIFAKFCEQYTETIKKYLKNFFDVVRFGICIKCMTRKEKLGNLVILELKNLLDSVGDMSITNIFDNYL